MLLQLFGFVAQLAGALAGLAGLFSERLCLFARVLDWHVFGMPGVGLAQTGCAVGGWVVATLGRWRLPIATATVMA